MKKITTLFFLAILGFSSVSFGFAFGEDQNMFPPRGSEVGAEAGHCNIGPFGRTGEIGQYEKHCNSLTVSERCLAYLKQHFKEEGRLIPSLDSAKATFCLNMIEDRFVSIR